MRIQDNIGDIELLEASLRGREGVDLFHDGSRRFGLFGKQNLQSASFKRTYVVALGKPWITARKVMVTFSYDHRQGMAQAKIPEEYLGALRKAYPEFQRALADITLHNNGKPMATILRSGKDGMEIIFRCPRCNDEIRHICQSKGGGDGSHKENKRQTVPLQ